METTATAAPLVINEGHPRRMTFLPKHFGKSMLSVEARVYVYASRVLEGYSGGVWEFVETEHTGYLRPGEEMRDSPEARWHWQSSDLSFGEGQLSSDAVGLALTIFAVNHEWHLDPENDQLARAWQALMDLAYQHPERSQLMPLLD